MKISRLLFKPKWQDKLAAVRLISVANDTDPELIEALPELTRSDPDARVRLAALKRLNDYERWRERSTGDDDGEVRRAARTAYIALLCSSAPGNPSLKRRVSELETLSSAEMEVLATTAKDRDLRAAALERVTRPALLAERATLDPDPALRLSALERTSDPALLERIAERARKTDKTISRVARERLASARISAGDSDAIATRARALCERIDALLRSSGSEEQQAAIQHEWQELGASVPSDLRARFEGAAGLLRNMRTAAIKPLAPATLADAEAMPPALEHEAAEATTSDAEVAAEGVDAPSAGTQGAPLNESPAGDAIVSRVRFDSALAAAAEDARRERERKQAALHRIDLLIAQYAERLEQGDTHGAHGVRKQLDGTAAEIGALPAALEHRLAPLHARLAELKRWQHWSNQRRRRTLCDDIEALADAGLHPDAIATRIREAREEWQRLEQAEGDDAESSGLARRFFGACQRALKPAQKYFDKRDELRDAQRTQLEALLARAEGPQPEDAFDVKAAIALRRELAEAMRSLDRFSPRDRGGLAKRLKQSIVLLTPRIEAHADSVAATKTRLIELAGTLALKPDRNSARGVRDLQQQWTAAGEGARGTDQKQWREFRAACDRVFAGLDAERNERDAQAAASAAQSRAVVEEAEALADDAVADANALLAQQRELETRWRAHGAGDRDLERRWRQASDRIAARHSAHTRDKKLARYADALRKYQILRQLEAGAAVESLIDSWTSGPSLIDRFAKPLDTRWTRASEGSTTPADEAEIENARDLLVRTEFAAGVASPADDRQRRMDYQISRLSARMRGTAANADAEGEVTELLASWFALPGPLPPELEQRFASACAALLAALP